MDLMDQPPILVVEDFAPVVRIYRHLLREIGLYDVDAATNGLEPASMINRRGYAAIISDWHMDRMTGFELLLWVRAKNRNVPFIMATIESRQESIQAAHQAGATKYMLKPFTAATLRAKLSSACPWIASTIIGPSPIEVPGAFVDVREASMPSWLPH